MANELETLPFGNGNPEIPNWSVGQKVIVRGFNTERIATITRITDGRNGTVYVGDAKYDSCGHERGGNQGRYSSFQKTWIKVPTVEEIQKVNIKIIRSRIMGMSMKDIPDDKILKIWEIIKPEKT